MLDGVPDLEAEGLGVGVTAQQAPKLQRRLKLPRGCQLLLVYVSRERLLREVDVHRLARLSLVGPLDLLRGAGDRLLGGLAEAGVEERDHDVRPVDQLLVDDALPGSAEAGYCVGLPSGGKQDHLLALGP